MEMKIKLTEELRKCFSDASKGRKNLPENVKQLKTESHVGLEEIKWLQQNRKGNLWLHDVLSRAEIELPEPYIAPRNPELEARCQRLRAQQDERDYRKMTKNVDPIRVRHPEDTIGYQINMINRQLIAVFQFVMSVAAGFAFGFLGIELIVGDLDFGFRLLLGVICSLIIALAEIYFLAKKLAEDYDEPDIAKSKID